MVDKFYILGYFILNFYTQKECLFLFKISLIVIENLACVNVANSLEVQVLFVVKRSNMALKYYIRFLFKTNHLVFIVYRGGFLTTFYIHTIKFYT